MLILLLKDIGVVGVDGLIESIGFLRALSLT